MEENVNFDNEVLAFLTIRKVNTLSIVINLSIGSTDRESQAVYPGTP